MRYTESIDTCITIEETNKFDKHIKECKTLQDVIWYLLLYRKVGEKDVI
jgi:hypothetical protein